MSTHRAENSSKVSSWCSERMRVDVLKLLGLATARLARVAMGWGRAAATRLARRKLEGPRTATRRREADIFWLWEEERSKNTNPGPGGVVRRAIGGVGGLDNDGLADQELNWVQSSRGQSVCVLVLILDFHGYWHAMASIHLSAMREPRCSLSRLAVVFARPANDISVQRIGQPFPGPNMWLGRSSLVLIVAEHGLEPWLGVWLDALSPVCTDSATVHRLRVGIHAIPRARNNRPLIARDRGACSPAEPCVAD